ncbi:MAG: methionine--tRNA ligase [Candidatus Bilamarchaeaceae archaeon]
MGDKIARIKKAEIRKKVLITSALPYVNNIPHLGNIIGCVLSADVFARYCRLRGYDVLYICGTDEYGTATEIKAFEEKTTPQEICKKYYEIHKKIYEWFGIEFDYFGRTSTQKHTEITQHIFLQLYKNGYVTEEEIEQLYDEKAKMFLADRYVEGTCPFCGYESARGDQCDKCGKLLQPTELINPLSAITKTKPIVKKSRHLFIDLPKLQSKVETWIEKRSKEGKWSENAIAIAKSWLKEGLKRRDITRDLKWGVPVPLSGYEDKVFYVWFDAPIGYISITADYTERWESWWKNPDEVLLYQFMGKDNVPFHTVIFPSTLLGTDEKWTMLYHISTTEYLNYEGGKFSKSRGIGVFGDGAMASGIPADVWRYYLLANRPETSDTNFTWEDFQDKTNNELIANLGNLVNRTLVFIANNFDESVPRAGELNENDKMFMETQKETISKIESELERCSIRTGLHLIVGCFAKNANKYFQENEPWRLIKTDRERAATVLNMLVNQIRDMAILIEPYLPYTSSEIFRQLNLDPSEKKWDRIGKPLREGHRIGIPKILFTKLEDRDIAALKKRFGGGQEKTTSSIAELDLEVGVITEVTKHPNAEKLYVERVKLGDEERQIVSGLVPYCREDELLGKKVIIVKNLMPAKLRGIDSNGMLLVVEDAAGNIELLPPGEGEVGDKVVAEGVEPKPKKFITIKDFEKIIFEVRDWRALADGIPLLIRGKVLKTEKIREGKIK